MSYIIKPCLKNKNPRRWGGEENEQRARVGQENTETTSTKKGVRWECVECIMSVNR
jgi:hypothetical protein